MTTEPTFTWTQTSAERYHARLGALPPAAQHHNAFLFGEASDLQGPSGHGRFLAYRVSDGVYYEGSRPVTRAEFRELVTTL